MTNTSAGLTERLVTVRDEYKGRFQRAMAGSSWVADPASPFSPRLIDRGRMVIFRRRPQGGPVAAAVQMDTTLSPVSDSSHMQSSTTSVKVRAGAAGAGIVAAYRERTPRSEQLAANAIELMPSGLAHDSRNFDPYPIYVARAAGPLKWDVDGNRYVDYFGGHGALILGHNHPKVVAAVHAALDRGTHFGACHELEVRWAELVCEMVPSAERVRFTSSGTEATLMALRLARAYTGRSKLLRFRGHFHGWHDHMTSGHHNHFDGTATAGVLADIAQNVILLPPGDEAALRQTLKPGWVIDGMLGPVQEIRRPLIDNGQMTMRQKRLKPEVAVESVVPESTRPL